MITVALIINSFFSAATHFSTKESLNAYAQAAYIVMWRNRPNKAKKLLQTGLESIFWLILAAFSQYVSLSLINFFIYRARHLNQLIGTEKQAITLAKHVFATQPKIPLISTSIYIFTLVYYLNKSFKAISQLTPAQALTKEEHEERTYGIKLAKRYHTNANEADIVLLLWIYDHIHPDDWIWLAYHQKKAFNKEQFDYYLSNLRTHFVNKKDYFINTENRQNECNQFLKTKDSLFYSDLEKKESYQKALIYLPSYIDNQNFHLKYIDD